MYWRPITLMRSALPLGGSLRSLLAYISPPPAAGPSGARRDRPGRGFALTSGGEGPAYGVCRTRPVIGLCTALEQARWSVWDQEAMLLPRSYLEAVRRGGGLAVMLPPDPALAEDP